MIALFRMQEPRRTLDQFGVQVRPLFQITPTETRDWNRKLSQRFERRAVTFYRDASRSARRRSMASFRAKASGRSPFEPTTMACRMVGVSPIDRSATISP